MNLFHALKFSVCCIAISLAGCQTHVTSTAPTPGPTPSITPARPDPTPPPKPEAVQTFEKRLRGELIKKAGINVQTVNCPVQVQVERQDPFTCEAIAEGKPFQVAVNPKTKPTKTANQNELRWNTRGLLVLPKLEQTIQQGLQQQFRLAVKVNCGGNVRVAKPGDNFRCQVRDQRGQTKAVTVRVDDEQGNVTWTL